MKRNTTQRNKDRATLRRAGLPCAICGEPIDYRAPHLDPSEFVADHIVPLAAGGEDNLANKQPAHRRCNAAKAARAYAPIIRRSASLARRPTNNPGG